MKLKDSTKNKLSTKVKTTGLKLLSILTVAAPIAIVVYSNLDKYVGIIPEEVVLQTVKISAGGIIAIGTAVLAAIGKLQLKFGWVLLGLLFAIFYLIEPIMPDLVLFTGIAFAGTTFNHIFIDGTIENLAKFGDMKTQALMTYEAKEDVEKLQQEYIAKEADILVKERLKGRV